MVTAVDDSLLLGLSVCDGFSSSDELSWIWNTCNSWGYFCRPPTKLRKGNVFTGICLSTGGGYLWSYVPSGRGWVGLVSGVFWGGYAWYQVPSGGGYVQGWYPPATPTLNEPEETDWKCSQTTETDGYKNGYIFTSSSFRSNAASIPELGPTSWE